MRVWHSAQATARAGSAGSVAVRAWLKRWRTDQRRRRGALACGRQAGLGGSSRTRERRRAPPLRRVAARRRCRWRGPRPGWKRPSARAMAARARRVDPGRRACEVGAVREVDAELGARRPAADRRAGRARARRARGTRSQVTGAAAAKSPAWQPASEQGAWPRAAGDRRAARVDRVAGGRQPDCGVGLVREVERRSGRPGSSRSGAAWHLRQDGSTIVKACLPSWQGAACAFFGVGTSSPVSAGDAGVAGARRSRAATRGRWRPVREAAARPESARGRGAAPGPDRPPGRGSALQLVMRDAAGAAPRVAGGAARMRSAALRGGRGARGWPGSGGVGVAGAAASARPARGRRATWSMREVAVAVVGREGGAAPRAAAALQARELRRAVAGVAQLPPSASMRYGATGAAPRRGGCRGSRRSSGVAGRADQAARRAIAVAAAARRAPHRARHHPALVAM